MLFHAPGSVQHVLLVFIRRVEGAEPRAHDYMTRGTGTGLFAGMFDFDPGSEQSFTQRLPAPSGNHGAFRAQLGVG
jgi:hypothetical protein